MHDKSHRGADSSVVSVDDMSAQPQAVKPICVTVDPADRESKDWLRLFLSEESARWSAPTPTTAARGVVSEVGDPLNSFSPEMKTTETVVAPADDARRISVVRRVRMAAAVLAIIGLAGAAAGMGGWIYHRSPGGTHGALVESRRTQSNTWIELPEASADRDDSIDAEPRLAAAPRAMSSTETSDDQPRRTLPIRSTSSRLTLRPIARSGGEPSSTIAAAPPTIEAEVPSIPPTALRASAATSDVDTADVGGRPAFSTVAAPEEAMARETGSIRNVLSRYQRAFNDLNASEAKAVWPTVDDRALGRAFGQLERQDVVFDACQIEIAGVRAVSSCNGRASYVPKVGNKTARIDSRSWTFQLRKIEDAGWMIEAVDSR